MADPIIRRYVPDNLPQGMPLSDIDASGPSMDFTGLAQDLIQRAHSRRMAMLEAFRPEQEAYSAERAQLEASQGQQDDFLAQLQQLMADQQQYSKQAAMREGGGVPLSQMAAFPPAMPTTLSGGMYQEPIAPMSDSPPMASSPSRPASGAFVRPVYAGGERVVDEVEVSKDLSFSDAFKAARKANASIFHWRGRTYSTKVK